MAEVSLKSDKSANEVSNEETSTSCSTHEAKEISSSDEDLSDEEIILDEASDTENFDPNSQDVQSDVEESSGDEEPGVTVEEQVAGKSKLYKLKFKDVEEKREEFLKEQLNDSEFEDSDNETTKEVHEKIDKSLEDKGKTVTINSFSDYRTVLDQDMDDYSSDKDADFDPVYCGETLSDLEYEEGDERDTESEPEVESLNETDRKTGEALKCIRMIEELKIPPPPSPSSSSVDVPQSPMECA